MSKRIWRISDVGIPTEGNRIHTRIDERYVTIFRNKGKLSCIDSICHHAGYYNTIYKYEYVNFILLFIDKK